MIKKTDGFTLLEIVISIAAVAIISVFILRMFVASSNLNTRAKDTDIAVNNSITEIERLKKHTSLSDYLISDAPGSVNRAADIVTVSFYYDNSWRLLIYPGIEIPKDAKYCLKMSIAPDKAAPVSNAANGVLCAVDVGVTDLTAGDSGLELAYVKAKKYFPEGLEGGAQ